MASVRELDLPAGWEPTNRARRYGPVALGALVSLAVLIGSVLGLIDPTVVGRLFALGSFLMGIGFAGGTFGLWRRGRPRFGVRGVDLAKSADGTPVLRIRQPRLLRVAGALKALCFGAGFLLIGVSLLIMGVGMGVLMLGCGAILAGMLPVMLTWGVPEIRLDEQGVWARGGGTRRSAGWDDVVLLSGAETRYQRRLLFIVALDVKWQGERLYWTTPARRRRNSEEIEIMTEQFAVAPVLLYHLLRFYHENPAARAELGRREALRRLHDARFPA
jgi:hypothetical protein